MKPNEHAQQANFWKQVFFSLEGNCSLTSNWPTLAPPLFPAAGSVAEGSSVAAGAYFVEADMVEG